jgi:UDP-N-acetylmuramate--alanine ligase
MRIYFAGLGGVGIGPLALIAKSMGHDCLGSDAASSRYTEAVAKAGIAVELDQTGHALATAHKQRPIDWYVYTAAMPDDHPELAKARKLGLKTSKRDEFLNRLIQDQGLKLIAASGTHGKTTVTGLLVWLFKRLGQPVSYAIGTNLSFGPSGQYQPGSQYFIYEADEFDRNMLQFRPYASVIPSLDYDHADTYPTKPDYLEAFARFVEQSHCVYMWRRDAEALRLDTGGCVHVFGSEARLDDIKLAGLHNRQNAYLALQCVRELLGRPEAELIKIVNDFPGTERRFEKLADNLYSDYAHHPQEISATLQLAHELNKKVVAVYQPHQNLRQHEIRRQYKNAFAGARQIYWLPTYLSREDESLPVLKPKDLIKELKDPGRAETAELDEQLKAKIDRHRKNGELVVLMNAGSLDAWARQQQWT